MGVVGGVILVRVGRYVSHTRCGIIFVTLVVLGVTSCVLYMGGSVKGDCRFVHSTGRGFMLRNARTTCVPCVVCLLLPICTAVVTSLSLVERRGDGDSVLLVREVKGGGCLTKGLFNVLVMAFLAVAVPVLVGLLLYRLACPVRKCSDT